MLQKDEKMRLGSKGDVREMLGNPWFKGMDCRALERLKVDAPYLAKLASDPRDPMDPDFDEED